MVEPLLYASLGACVAGLIGLLLLPAIWARAVRLTTRRLVGRLPVSLDEIVAAQDRLRAEHAIGVRTVERRAEAAVEEAARERIAAGHARSHEMGLKLEIAKLKESVAALEAHGAVVRGDLDRTGAEAAEISRSLESERAASLAARREADEARKALSELELARDAMRVELAATEAELASALAQQAASEREIARLRGAVQAGEAAASGVAATIEAERSRVGEAEAARQAAERRLAMEIESFVAFRADAARPAAAGAPADADLAALRARLDELADEIVRASGAPRPPEPPRSRTPLQQAAERVRLGSLVSGEIGAQ